MGSDSQEKINHSKERYFTAYVETSERSTKKFAAGQIWGNEREISQSLLINKEAKLQKQQKSSEKHPTPDEPVHMRKENEGIKLQPGEKDTDFRPH